MSCTSIELCKAGRLTTAGVPQGDDSAVVSSETGADSGDGAVGCLPCTSGPPESPLEGLDIVYHAVENVRIG